MKIDLPVERGRQPRAVGYHQQTAAGSGDEIARKRKNVIRRRLIEVAGGLVGEKQKRLHSQRAADRDPLLLLADEPTGNLDEDTADEVLALARDLVARSGCGFLMVTHSARLAATLDRQVNLHAGVIA